MPPRSPGLRAEALEYHRRAGMPEEMLSDERSVTFMMSGAMTQNKNVQVGLSASSLLSPRFLSRDLGDYWILSMHGIRTGTTAGCRLPIHLLSVNAGVHVALRVAQN
jgi:hypothetical protein